MNNNKIAQRMEDKFQLSASSLSGKLIEARKELTHQVMMLCATWGRWTRLESEHERMKRDDDGEGHHKTTSHKNLSSSCR